MAQQILSPDQEKTQLKRLLEGDVKAFDYFNDSYSLPVYQKILKMTKVEFVAEDILQTVFIKIWEKRHLIDPEKGLKAYIYQIAQNLVYDFYRNLAREGELQAQVRYAVKDITEDAAANLLFKETRELLELAIEQLPEITEELLSVEIEEPANVKEAERLNIVHQLIKTEISRRRTKLRTLYLSLAPLP